MASYAMPGMPLGRWRGAGLENRQHEVKLSSLEIDLIDKRPVRVKIVGHSFICHILKGLRKLYGIFHNFGIEEDVVEVSYLAQGGMHIDDVEADEIADGDPDIVYIELGTCDLDVPGVNGNAVGRQLYQLAQAVENYGVKRVIVGEVIFRQEKGIPGEATDYNYQVMNMNRYLQSVMAPQNNEHFFFWRHKYLWGSKIQIYDDDGIHLNELGDTRLYRSIRGAIFKMAREIKDEL